MTAQPAPKIVMSGMRPTGRLHLGHYYGVLTNWTKLQSQHSCYFMIADWHALTTRYDETVDLRQNIHDMMLDWLAAGIDPEKSTIYVQSAIPEIAELHLLLSMLTPAKWVQTDPTLKDLVVTLHEELNYGLLGYPVLQTADILAMRGDMVPVGKDQLAHLEISRDIARRFNHVYKSEFFPEPKPLLTETSMLVGLDGRKMSKSYDNAVYLGDSEDDTWKRVKTAITDKNRIKKDDPGNPEICQGIFPYYQVIASKDAIALADHECRAALRGCMDCKKTLTEIVNETLRPLRDRRKQFESDPGAVDKMLALGCEKARETAAATLRQVRSLMKLYNG